MDSDDSSEVMQQCLLLLQEEAKEQYITAVQTLSKIVSNILQHPGEAKYKEIKKSNKAFNEKVWKFAGAQQFLFATGWVETDDTIVSTDDEKLALAISHLHQVCPPSPPRPQVTGQSSGATSQQSQVLTEAKKRQLEHAKKEREEKKRIKDQIEADRNETRNRELRDSRAVNRHFGSRITRFEDVGVDLNGGGG